MRVSALSRAARKGQLAVLVSAGLAGAALPATGLLAGPASAANSPVCVYSATTATCTFAYSAFSYSWTVPTGVSTLNVTADGGSGQGVGLTPGGAGAAFLATLTGTSGKTLTITTGGQGAGRAGGKGYGGEGGTGFGIGGTDGGGGGGATTIRAGLTTLVVAGGGGGAASGNTGGNAGTSSSTIAAATTGANGSSASPPFSTGGRGGSTVTATGGAAGGSPICSGTTAGTFGRGGHGATCRSSAGGGGGSGYYGGGGGGNSSGGGGGSSFPAIAFASFGITVTPVTSVTTNTGNGSVVITYALTGTNTLLTSAPNPSNQGQSVALTATVSPTNGNGTVTFYANFVAITGCTNVPITHLGRASCNTSTLPPGKDLLTAVYSGDTVYGTSTSNIVNQVVLIRTTTTLTSARNPSTVGQSVTFIATVSPTDGGGTVTFKNHGVPITGCTAVALIHVSGSYQATCVTSTLPGGTNPITAVYSGDAVYAGSTSNTVSQVVNPARTSLIAFGSIDSGGNIHVAAVLTSDGAPVKGKLITFTAGPGITVCASITDDAGIARCTASHEGGVAIALSQGVFTATFAGTNSYQPSKAIGIVNGH
jgi:hypothetical protein